MSKETNIHYKSEDGTKYIFESGAGSLSLQKKEELTKLFWAIADVVKKYKVRSTKYKGQKLSPIILTALAETQKNVDEAVLQAIQTNPQVLFIRAGESYDLGYPLWELICNQEYLPKTMEFIMKHPTARFVESHQGWIIPWQEPMRRTQYILNIAAEIPEYRTFLCCLYGNLGMYIASEILGESENNRGITDKEGIDLVSKYLDYADCSTQQNLNGLNIGHYCILSARSALIRYDKKREEIERKLSSDKSLCHSLREQIQIMEQRLQSGEESKQSLQEKLEILQKRLEAIEQRMKQYRTPLNKEYELAKKLQDLAKKSMALYPETAHQESNIGTLANMYVALCIDFENGIVEAQEEQVEKQMTEEKPAEDDIYSALIPSPEDLARQLSI